MQKTDLDLRERFAAPSLPADFFPRERLNRIFTDAGKAKITYVSAAAGWGKTAAAAAYIRDCGKNCAWLSISESNNIWSKILEELTMAVRLLTDNDRLPTGAHSGIPNAVSLSPYLFSRIGTARVTLVIDNAERLTESDARGVLSKFIEGTPSNWHFIIISEKNADALFNKRQSLLPIEYIGAYELRLTREEQLRFLESHGIVLEKCDLFRVMNSTDGRIAALSAVTQAVVRRSDKMPAETERRARGEQKNIPENIEESIFSQLGERTEALLGTLSVLERADARLAEFVSGCADAKELLEEALEFGGFVRRLEDGSYSVSDIFGNLQPKSPAERKRILLNAAEYYEQCGELQSALFYAAKSGDRETVIRLLENSAAELSSASEPRKIWVYLDGIDNETISASPALCYIKCVRLAALYRPEECYMWYRRLLSLRSAAPYDKRRELENMIYYVRLLLPQSDLDDIFDAVNALFIAGTPLGHLGLTGNVPSVLRGVKDFSDCILFPDKLREINPDHLTGVFGARASGLLKIGLGEMAYERGDLEDALGKGNEGLSEAIASGTLETVYAGTAFVARCYAARGESDKAMDVLSGLAHKFERCREVYLVQNYKATLMRFLLLKGMTGEPLLWAATQAPDYLTDFVAYEHYAVLTKAKIMLAVHRYDEAVGALIFLKKFYELYGRTLDCLECSLYLALCYFGSGDNARAFDCLDKLLPTARMYGYVRIFADGGSGVMRLLEAYKEQRVFDADAALLDRLIYAARAFGELFPDYLSVRGRVAETEPLTEAEKKVLALWTEGYSQAQISKKLFITVGTVKWHLTNIRDKLGVREKADIIRVTKENKLLM